MAYKLFRNWSTCIFDIDMLRKMFLSFYAVIEYLTESELSNIMRPTIYDFISRPHLRGIKNLPVTFTDADFMMSLIIQL